MSTLFLLTTALIGGQPASPDLTCIAVAPREPLAAAGCSDGTVSLVDLCTGPTSTTLQAGPGSIARLAWDGTGTRLAAAAFVTVPGDIPADAERASIHSPARWIVWDVPTGSILLDERSTEPGLHDPTLELSPDGAHLITLGCEEPADLWDLVHDRHLARLDRGVRITTATWSPDGARVFTGDDAGQVCAWSAHDGLLVRVASLGPGPVSALRASPDGKRMFAACSQPSTLASLRASNLQLEWQRELRIGGIEEDRIVSLAVDPESSGVVTGTSVTGMIETWDARDGRHVTLVAPDWFHEACVCVLFDPSGDRIAVSGSIAFSGRGARVIDAIGGSDAAHFRVTQSRGGRGSLSWTGDGRYLVARGAELVVLDGETLQSIRSWSPSAR